MKEITPTVIAALHELREEVAYGCKMGPGLEHAFKVLEDVGVFDRIDEVADGKADIVVIPVHSEVTFYVELVYHTVTDNKASPSVIHQTSVQAVDQELALRKASDELHWKLQRAGRLGDGVELVVTSGTTSME